MVGFIQREGNAVCLTETSVRICSDKRNYVENYCNDAF